MSAIRVTLMLIATAWFVAFGWYHALNAVAPSPRYYPPPPQVEE